MTPKEKRAKEVYQKTKSLANRNAFVQGFSGIIGSGFNLAVDAAAIPFYIKLWNDIREVYGKGKITPAAAKAYIKPNLGFLAQDLIWDKLVGTIPVIGMPFNAAFAKALTWRLGAWFGLLSALNEESVSDEAIIRATIQLTQEVFPSVGDTFTFKGPDQKTFVSFIAAQDGLSTKEAARRVKVALDVMQGRTLEAGA